MPRLQDEHFTPESDAPQARRSAAALRSKALRDDDLDEPLDSRLNDLDDDDEGEAQFLRGQRRVAVRRSPLPKKTANRLKTGFSLFAAAAAVVLCGALFYNYGSSSWRFRIDSGDQIAVGGLLNVTKRQVMDVMGADIGRNVFFVPLGERKKQLEEIPWIETATVMRLLPNTLKVEIAERTPVAFVRVGSKIALMDAHGVLLDMPAHPATKYSFPVIVGANESEPLSTRSARMKIFQRLMQSLDGSGARYSQDISEVDLSDPDDVKVMVSDPQGAVLIHLGSSDFLERYKLYVAHADEWRQQFSKLESVDLRYEGQVIVNPDARGHAAETAPAPKPQAVAPKAKPPAKKK